MIALPTRDLRTALTAVMSCAADEEYLPSLYGVHWRALGDEITLTATDGFIIGEQTIRLESDQQGEAWSGLVPLRGCKAILEWIKHRAEIAVTFEGEALSVYDGREYITIGLWTLDPLLDYRRVWIAAAPNKTKWTGSVARFFERPTQALGNYSIIEIGDCSFDFALAERAIGSHSPKDHITIATGKPGAPVLVTGPHWRAAIMLMTGGAR